jgi:hypothetical protein
VLKFQIYLLQINQQLSSMTSLKLHYQNGCLAITSPCEVEVNLRPTVSRPACLGVGHPSETPDQLFFLLEIFFRQLRVCYFTAPSLKRGRVCNLLYFASGPCQSSDSWVEAPQNPRPYFTVSHETPPTWRVKSPYLYPPGTGWPSYTPSTEFPFCRLLQLAGLRWRDSNPPPHGYITC